MEYNSKSIMIIHTVLCEICTDLALHDRSGGYI